MRTFTITERLLARLNFLPTPIYDTFVAPLFGKVVSSAVRLNLFEILPQPLTTAQVAQQLAISPQAAALMLKILCITGYVGVQGERFHLTAAGKKWFSKSSPSYLGNFVQYVELLNRHWMYLEETVRRGKPPVTYFDSFGEREWRLYVYGMMDLARVIYPFVASKIVIPLRATQLIDLGGSHGWYSIQLCKRHPDIRATIVDFPQALKFTSTIIHDHSLDERVTLLPGNVLTATLEKSYDLALAFNITHGLTKDENVRFFEKVFHTLTRDGRLYILDQCPAEKGSATQRLIPLIVGINIMNEVGGNVYSPEEYREWLAQAGFRRIKTHRLRLPGVFLLSART